MSTISKSADVSALLKFLDLSPSPFHAVDQARQMLESAGFQRLVESLTWKLIPNGKYFFTRNGSSLVAFTNAEKSGVNIIAAHTDSPCLRVKPISNRRAKDGFLQVAVESYGGGLWNTWFDRDLGLAGRVVAATKDGKLRERLVNIDRSILRVPTLAIHLDRTVNSEGFKFNTELQLNPILATELMESKKSEWIEAEKTERSPPPGMHKSLSDALKKMAKTEEEEIVGLDLCLYDVQKAALGGIHSEFIQSARLDNLFMSFCGLKAMIDCASSIEKDLNVRMLALFDNEEVGSESAAGAESTLVGSTITRILGAFNTDVNITDHYGIVLKYNSNQRYCTNSRSAAFIKHLAAKASIPLQEFMVRNDSPCGSTIGPILSAQLGLQAVDVGAPQLSMHSIREMAGVEDIANSINLFSTFYESSTTVLSIRTLDCLD